MENERILLIMLVKAEMLNERSSYCFMDWPDIEIGQNFSIFEQNFSKLKYFLA